MVDANETTGVVNKEGSTTVSLMVVFLPTSEGEASANRTLVLIH